MKITPRPADFDIVERIGKHCQFEDGVFVFNDGEGDSYFNCELPLCENGDRIEIGGLYEVNHSDEYVEILDMKLDCNFHKENHLAK
ncbi:hypothetical protein [Microcoleus sp. bin38.metabat.b11b12b14.051]|uniref:hypothetical protein n=1 Tax=Microcoleus sp. bin38.metabat.b11b12b14.051 TaxID=2742709 RepID=UPI0025FD2353|nr:hypothetical protein [Microcoleus sp. bin38.metabat.b11b12b14.051]